MENITLDQIIELLPAKTSLSYVDYNDSLDSHMDLLQQSFHEGNLTPLYENSGEWFWEQEAASEREEVKNLRNELVKTYDITEEEAEELTDQYEDEISEQIRERDSSTPIDDLIRNTQNPITFYDTDYEVEENSWNWSDAKLRLKRMLLKKELQIKNSKYDQALDTLLLQASYGGKLQIYFHADIKDFTNDNNAKSIIFKNPSIGIIDSGNGSGDTTDLIGHEMKLPFNRENLFIEKTIKYNWTYSIAGMVHDWCARTDYEFSTEDCGEVATSSLNDLQKQEEEYNKTFREGGCTFGDMDYNRHRKKEYRNDYPCGSKCTECGTFWID